MKIPDPTDPWQASFNRYALGDTVTWTVEAKRPDGTPFTVADVHGRHDAPGHGKDLTPGQARDFATLIAQIPRMRGALACARVALVGSPDVVHREALEVLRSLDDVLCGLP